MSRSHLQSLFVDLLEDLLAEYITEMVVMLCIKGRANDVPILKKLPTLLLDEYPWQKIGIGKK